MHRLLDKFVDPRKTRRNESANAYILPSYVSLAATTSIAQYMNEVGTYQEIVVLLVTIKRPFMNQVSDFIG